MTPANDLETPQAGTAWWLRLILVVVGLALWFGTQSLIGNRQLTGEGIVDMPLRWTAPANRYLHENAEFADLLLIVSSLIIDVLGIFLLTWSVFGPSVRPFIGLLILFSLRQACQAMVALPAPPDMIWPDGELRAFPCLPVSMGGMAVPSLLVTYQVANDFFFSGHTALAVYGAVELARLRRRWLVVLAVMIVIFESLVVIVLRAHWTMDVFAGAITALFVAQLAAWLAPYCDRALASVFASR